VLENLAARSWMQPRPGTMIESRTRRRHSGICVSRLRPGELDEGRAVPGGVHGPSRAIDRTTTLAANEKALRNAGPGGELPPIGRRYRVRNHAFNQSFRGLTN
jgi:hypothetical protein